MPAEGRENHLLKKGNSDAFFREKYLTKNSHEWQASVKARSNGEKCLICSGARVIAGINDLATLEPLKYVEENYIFGMAC